MALDIVSAIFATESTEEHQKPGAAFDPHHLIRYAHAIEDAGIDAALFGYSSGQYDNFVAAGLTSAHTEALKLLIALRPNTAYPTVAAKALATLDRVSGGRAAVHVISGGSAQEQAREGDRLDKTARYDRTAEYIGLLRRIWREQERFDHHGDHYSFDDFVADIHPETGRIPVSLGGSSPEAFRVGVAHADTVALWAEPLDSTAEQIAAIRAHAVHAGVAVPRIWVSFRPILAPTDALAAERAERILARLGPNGVATAARGVAEPQNVGSRRLLAAAQQGDVHDRALWTRTVTAVGGHGASAALVGSPETVTASILAYLDLGVDVIALRGYDNLNDVIDFGRYLVPDLRAEATRRLSAEVPA